MGERVIREIDTVNVLTAKALTLNAVTRVGEQFPMGEAWYRANLRIGLALTIGTGTTPIAEGELKIIKNIELKTDRGEVLCNLPGRALYKIAHYRNGAGPIKDAIAAATATYNVNLPIYFADESLAKPEDTILDTARYRNLQLNITMGGLTDLLGTVGTSALTATIDMEVERTAFPLPDGVPFPLFYVNYDTANPQDANSQTFIDLPRSSDLAYKRLYAHECATGTAGVSFGGTTADDVKSIESLKDSNRSIIDSRVHEMIQASNAQDAGLDAKIAGTTVFDFVRDGSLFSALESNARSRLQLTWTNKAGVASGDIVSLAYEAIRKLAA
jgi:hypothetical protein